MFDFGSLGNLAKSGAEFIKEVSSVASDLSNREEGSQAVAASESQKESMYSAQLEKLIAMAIEDGDITDEDIAMLRRRAEKEGVDPDELEFVVRKRIKKTMAYKDLSPVQRLHKMLADCDAESKSATNTISGFQRLSGLVAEDMMGNGKKAAVLAGFPFPENSDDFVQIVNFLIAEFETGISPHRETGLLRDDDSVEDEKIAIKRDAYLSSLDSKLRIAAGMNICTPELRNRIKLVLDPPARKKLFGLF